MGEPLVSVCMITYNHLKYIERAIQGVLGQKTEFPFELVIGEDCSNDGTREVVLEYQARYPEIIRVITSEENVGLRENEARTVAACRGKYVAFCEGDDHWHRRDKLAIQVTYLESHPECGMVCSEFDLHDVATGDIITRFNEVSKMSLPVLADIYGILTCQYRVLTLTVVVRRQILAEVVAADPYLYRGNAFLMTDTQKWAEISLLSRIGYIDEALATYTKSPESVSRSRDRVKLWRYMVSGDAMNLYLCDKHALHRQVREHFWLKWSKDSLELAFLERDLARAETVLSQGYVPSCRERIKCVAMRSHHVHAVVKTVLSVRQWLGRRVKSDAMETAMRGRSSVSETNRSGR